MNKLLLFIALFTTTALFSQRKLVAPPDIYFNCEYGFELDNPSILSTDHPILGKIQSSSTLIQPIIIRDRVCEAPCSDHSKQNYLASSAVGMKACQFYNDLFDPVNPEKEYDLNWGMEGYAEGYDSIYLYVEDESECNRGLIRRFIVGVYGNQSDTVHHDIWILNCVDFFISQNDPNDPNDCLDWDFESPLYINCTDGPLDSIIKEKSDKLLASTVLGCEDCDLIAIDYSDEIYSIDADFSFKIIRTWTIINWCDYDHLNPLRGGRWEFIQIIYFSCGTPGIQGTVYIDDNDDCLWDEQTEQTLWNWKITAESATDTYHALSNQKGIYYLHIPDDDYSITLTPPNSAWTSCQSSWPVTSDTSKGTVTQNLGANALISCRDPHIEITPGRLRRCRDNTYFISYGNNGTIPIKGSKIEVELDQYMTITSATIPHTHLGGRKYALMGGDLNPGEVKNASMEVYVDCDSTRTGQTLCVKAQISPSDTCDFELFNGPIISTQAECTGDEVILTVKNEGSAMSESLHYWVVEDDLIMFLKSFKLGNNKSQPERFPATGKTYMIIAEQDKNFPAGRHSITGLEGCRPMFTDHYTRGFLSQFAMGSGYDFVDTDCSEITGAFDPNDKQVYPKGYGTSAYIRRDQELDYTIRFQNTGNDTAF